MPRYTVVIRPGADNEVQTEHRTWGAAMSKARNSSVGPSGAIAVWFATWHEAAAFVARQNA